MSGILSYPENSHTIKLLEIPFKQKNKTNHSKEKEPIENGKKGTGSSRKLNSAHKFLKIVCSFIKRFLKRKLKNLKKKQVAKFKKALEKCGNRIREMQTSVVETNGKFKMLMPDGKFLEILIYRYFVKKRQFENYEDKFEVNYTAEMINGD